MATLLIRNVDEVLHKRLKESAVSHRRSLEEEVRELLRAALAREGTGRRENLAEVAQRLFGNAHGVDLDIPPRGPTPIRPPPDFREETEGPAEML